MEQAQPVAGAEQIEELIATVSEAFANGNTLGDLMGYVPRDYESVYALGHRYYRQARYLDALKAFSFLVMHNPLERKFANAQAASLQMLKQYDNAIAFYSLASVMDMTDPRPTFHTAECLIALGRVEEAIDALNIVIKQSTAPEFAALNARTQGLLNLCSVSRGENEGGVPCPE